MATPYFPPPPSSTSTTSRRKRLSFPALPSPSEAFAPLFKSRLAIHKKIASNRFSSSSSSSTSTTSTTSSSSSPLSPTSWQFNPSHQPHHHKTKKESISRPIISPTRAKPPVTSLTMTSGRVVAVGLPCSPRIDRPTARGPIMVTRPPALAEEDLAVYSAFDPRPLPGPPPRPLPRSPKPPARLQPQPVPVSADIDIDVDAESEESPEAYYDVRYEMNRQMARMSDTHLRGQGHGHAPTKRERKQPPKPLALSASKESQWEVMSAPPVMVPRHPYREEIEVPIRLEGMGMGMKSVGVWEGIGARSMREL